MLNRDHGSQQPPIPAAPTPGIRTGLEARCCGTSGTCWQFCCPGVTILCRLLGLPQERWLQTSPNLPQPSAGTPAAGPCPLRAHKLPQADCIGQNVSIDSGDGEARPAQGFPASDGAKKLSAKSFAPFCSKTEKKSVGEKCPAPQRHSRSVVQDRLGQRLHRSQTWVKEGTEGGDGAG